VGKPRRNVHLTQLLGRGSSFKQRDGLGTKKVRTGIGPISKVMGGKVGALGRPKNQRASQVRVSIEERKRRFSTKERQEEEEHRGREAKEENRSSIEN